MKRMLALTLIILTGIIDLLSVIVRMITVAVRIIKRIIALFLRIKRALGLIIIMAACVAGFLSIRGQMPFMAIFGTSMEPELHAGNLILIKKVLPDDVKVGDIIVFTIPSAVREYYNYPPVVAHRVINVRQSETGVTWRTKGDNTGEDPFTVRPQDILGHVSKQIPYLGFPLLFFQSQQGLIFIVIALFLLTLYLYADEISRGRQKLHRGIFAPVIQESQHTSQEIGHRLEQRMESAEKGMEQRIQASEKGMEYTQQALNSFAAAMAEYAKHLQSHTSAIQGLSEASHELRKGAAEQNKVLARLLETMEQKGPPPEREEETAVAKVEEKVFPPGCVRNRP